MQAGSGRRDDGPSIVRPRALNASSGSVVFFRSCSEFKNDTRLLHWPNRQKSLFVVPTKPDPNLNCKFSLISTKFREASTGALQHRHDISDERRTRRSRNTSHFCDMNHIQGAVQRCIVLVIAGVGVQNEF